MWQRLELRRRGIVGGTLRRYFRRLQRRYCQDPAPATGRADAGTMSSEDGRGYPVICVNLLRLNEQRRNEHLLTEKFDEVLLLLCLAEAGVCSRGRCAASRGFAAACSFGQT